MSPIEQFLSAYARELARRGVPSRRRILFEAEDHLLAAVSAISGPSAEAQEIAIRRFGSPHSLASEWPAYSRLHWSVLSVVGLTVALAFSMAVGKITSGLITHDLIMPAIGFVLGLGLGLAQWVVIRGSFGWVTGTAVGLMIGITLSSHAVESIGFTKRQVSDDLVALAMVGAMTGAALAALQELASVRRIYALWVFRAALGTAVGCVCGGSMAILLLGDFRSFYGLLLVAAMSAAVLAHTASPALSSAILARE